MTEPELILEIKRLKAALAISRDELMTAREALEHERTLRTQAHQDLQNYQQQFRVMEEAMLKINAACDDWRRFLGT